MIHLIRLLAAQGSLPRKRVLIAAFLAGVTGALVLAIVNIAAREIAVSGRAEVDWRLATAFVVGISIYAVSERFAISRICMALESAIHDARKQLLERLARADFEKVERVGRVVFYESITQATHAISQNSQFLALALRSIVLVLAILAYIAYASTIAFVLVMTTLLIAGLAYRRAGQRLDSGFVGMMDEENRLFENLGDLLDGFKEVRMSSARSNDLAAIFARLARTLTDIRIDVQSRGIHQFILGQVSIFFLLAIVVFVVPLYSADFRDHVVQVTTSVMFVSGIIGALIQTMPVINAADQAAARISQLDALLQSMEEPDADRSDDSLSGDFREISLKSVTYAYPAPEGESAFALGPIDLTLRRGEIIFVTGGNGAGKSTLIKILTGLYRPQAGTVRIDGVAIGPRTRHAYRDLLSTIFSDYHLFPRLYGVDRAALEEAPNLLSWLEMAGVTGLDGDHFERSDLSAGQRKRLALVTALLERRPLLVLDEWAADQDPHFRRKFYHEILPALKAGGKTIVAVTHDDAYFHIADRRFHLEEGRLMEQPQRRGEVG
jgi:putative ATP-binding cassette transporter